jgi:hypothetical protein
MERTYRKSILLYREDQGRIVYRMVLIDEGRVGEDQLRESWWAGLVGCWARLSHPGKGARWRGDGTQYEHGDGVLYCIVPWSIEV